MTKSPWEARVGMLLNPEQHPKFAYSFKPADSAMYGGQPRIDWLACDIEGRFWMIEVKTLPPKRKTFDPRKLLSPGQIQALDALANTARGMALLAVAYELAGIPALAFFNWRQLRWLPSPSRLDPSSAALSFMWTGPKAWQTMDLYEELQRHIPLGMGWTMPLAGGGPPPSSCPGIVPTPTPSVWPSSPILPVPSPSISKPKGSIRTRRKKLLSAL